MKMIRWQGFLAFSLIVAAIFLSFYLFAASFIKWGIESSGESAFNAKVNVNSVKLNYSPLSIAINGMTVGDESEAMVNLFEFERAAVSVDFWKLMMGQVIVKDLDLQGLAFGTTRKASGLLVKKSGSQAGDEDSISDDVKEGLKEVAEKAPDAKTLLAREPLKTDAAYKTLTESIAQKKTYWADVEKTLPNKDAVKLYEQQVKALFEGDIKSVQDFEQRKKKLDQLKQDMKADRLALSQAKDQLKEDRVALKQQFSTLKNAPKADYEHLKSKYGLNAGGIANISGLLFGAEIGNYSHTFLHWYNKAQPFIARAEAMKKEGEADEPVRAKGRFIRFYEKNPQPDFIIQKADLSLLTPQGTIQAKAKDITHQQALINRPTTIQLTADQLDNIHGFSSDIILDYRQEPGLSTATFDVAKLVIADQKISGSNKLALTLQLATGVINGSAKLSEGVVTAQINNQFNQAQFKSSGQSSMAREVGAAIEGIHDFDLNIAVKGAVDELDISIKSNIDNKLKSAFKGRLSAKKKEWQANLDKALNERLSGYLTKVDPNLGLGDGKGFSENIGQLDNLLKSQLTDYTAQQKAKAKKEADAKKAEAKKKADAEKAEAKRKADAEKAKQKDKAKNKLKSLF
ncbi:MAG: TIGR03545 family protein [Pseudomonadales bacterium]|nr:TIGR03545 family protein [Pseudomonadales bacterium]